MERRLQAPEEEQARDVSPSCWIVIVVLVAVTADLWVPQCARRDPTASDTATMAAQLPPCAVC
ncbi:MAG: hypothetical protein ACLTSX_08220 [Collinsella sp.]